MSDDLDLEALLEGLSELFEAAIHGERVNENLRRLEGLDEELKNSVERLRLLQGSIEASVEDYVEATGDPDAKVFAENIKKFVTAAAKQEEARLQKKFGEDKKAVEAAANSEAEMARSGLESFLARNLLKTEEKHFSLRLVEDSYILTARYRCAGAIEYEFTLDTKANHTFSEPLTPALFDLKPRIPVAIGKSWIKQSTPQMVKIEKYVLREADATPNSLIYVLGDPEGEAQVRIVYTKNERASNVSVTYTDESGRVDVSANPTLAKHLDTDTLKILSEVVLDNILKLEQNRLRLTELTVSGKDTLAEHSYFEFLLAALEQLPVKPQSIYTLSAQAGLEEKAKTVLGKIEGFGEKAQTLYAKFTPQNQSRAD